MMSSSLQGKMMQLEDQSMDAVAEKELQELEQRLGLAAPSTTAQLPSSASDVESELSELEQRLSSQQPPQQS